MAIQEATLQLIQVCTNWAGGWLHETEIRLQWRNQIEIYLSSMTGSPEVGGPRLGL